MAALAHLLGKVGRGAARGGRAINDALTDEEIDPNTGEVIRRPSRIAQGLGEAIRAGVVAAGSPTPGHVGSAQDVFGSLRAVEQDKQQRQDRASQQRQRQMAEEMARQRSVREQRDSDSEYEWREAQVAKEEALAAKANRAQDDPEDIKRYEYAHKQALDAGLGPDKAHAHGMAAMTRQTTGFLAPVEKPGSGTFKKPEEYLTNKYAQEMDALDKEPELDPTFERGRYLTGEMQKLSAPPERPTTPRVMTNKEGDVVVVDPKQATSRAVAGPDGKPLKAPFGMGRRRDGDGSTSAQREAIKINQIIDRIRREDTGGTTETARRNVDKFYQDDPEVAGYRSKILAELDRRIRAEKAGKKGMSATEAKAKGMPPPAKSPSAGGFSVGEEVDYQGKRAVIKAIKPDGSMDLELVEE